MSPKPGTGRPQYFQFKNCFFLTLATDSRYLTRRGQTQHSTTSLFRSRNRRLATGELTSTEPKFIMAHLANPSGHCNERLASSVKGSLTRQFNHVSPYKEGPLSSLYERAGEPRGF